MGVSITVAVHDLLGTLAAGQSVPIDPDVDIDQTLHGIVMLSAKMTVQANNAYIFPAIGFAAILTRASHISDDIFLVAARCLSEMTSKEARSLPSGLPHCLKT